MKKINKFSNSDLTRLVKKIILEQPEVPFGYEENFANIPKEKTMNLPTNLKNFVDEYDLLSYGQLQRKGNEFKYVPTDGSEITEFTLDEFNIYDKFYKDYEKYEAIIEKFDQFT